MAFAPPRPADSCEEVLRRSYSAKAAQVVASVSPPGHVRGPRFPTLLACGNGSGSSSLLARLQRRRLGFGAPRTSRHPVRCHGADRTLRSSEASRQESVGELDTHLAELERLCPDPEFPGSDTLVPGHVHLDMGFAALNIVDVPSKALTTGNMSRASHLEEHMLCSVLVVVSALEELLDDRTAMKNILSQLHKASHAQAQHKVYLVLSKIDKVVEEDVFVSILDRLLAGLLADGTEAEVSAGLTAEPCLADFDGIFAVVSGHPTIESGSELAAYEAGKLESIQEVASSHAEYAPYMAALQSRLGCGALWEHIVEQDLDQHSLRWLKDEQVPLLQQRLKDAVADLDALPSEHISLEAVMDDLNDKVKASSLFMRLRLPELDMDEVRSPSRDPAVRYGKTDICELKEVIASGEAGQPGSKKWADASPKMRELLALNCTSASVTRMAEDAIKEAISAAFQCPSASADTLRLARFTGLLAELTEKALKSVMLQEDEEHGRYIDATLQHYTAQWHLSNGPAQVLTNVQDAMLDLAAESAVRCLHKIVDTEAMLDFELKENDSAATHRAALYSKVCNLHAAIGKACEIEAQSKQPKPEPRFLSSLAHEAETGNASQWHTGQPAAGHALAEEEVCAALSPLPSTPAADEATKAVSASAETIPSTHKAGQQARDAAEACMAPVEESAGSEAPSAEPTEDSGWQLSGFQQ